MTKAELEKKVTDLEQKLELYREQKQGLSAKLAAIKAIMDSFHA